MTSEAKADGPSRPAITQASLQASAQDVVKRCLRAYIDQDDLTVGAFAGIASEHLVKAYLCSFHPTLILDNNAQRHVFSSLILLNGLEDRIPVKPQDYVRTVGLGTALDRVAIVLPGFVVDEAVKRVVDLRNGMLHAGQQSGPRLRQDLATVLAVCSRILTEMGVAADEFFGSFARTVESLLDEAKTERWHEAERKIAAAKRRFAHLEALGGGNVLAEIEMSTPDPYLPDASFVGAHYCPVCDSKAWMGGELDISWYDDESMETRDTPEGLPEGSEPIIFLYPHFLVCKICELELVSTEELSVAHLASAEQLRDSEVDVEAYLADGSLDAYAEML